MLHADQALCLTFTEEDAHTLLEQREVVSFIAKQPEHFLPIIGKAFFAARQQEELRRLVLAFIRWGYAPESILLYANLPKKT